MNTKKYNITYTEIFVVVIMVMVLFIMVFSIILTAKHATATSRQSPCASNIRQLAMAATMYSQDHKGRMMDIYKRKANGEMSNIYTGWVDNLINYVKNGNDIKDIKEIFFCYEDNVPDKGKLISYGYNSCMLYPDGSGIKEDAIKAPTRVGLFCDASPGIPFPAVRYDNNKNIYGGGGIIGGYSLIFSNTLASERKTSQLTVYPCGRHYGGVITGYADGHVKLQFERYEPKNSTNSIVQSFYMATTLGLVENPSAGLGGSRDIPFGTITPAISGKKFTVIGGDAVTRPILRAACEVAKKIMTGFNYKEDGFNGSLSTKKRPDDYIEGVVTATPPSISVGRQKCYIPIGIDAMVVVVNKNCAIRNGNINLDKKKSADINDTYYSWRQIDLSDLQLIIQSDGCQLSNNITTKNKNNKEFQLYVQNKNDASRKTIATKSATFTTTGGFGVSYYDDVHNIVNNKNHVQNYKGIYCNNDLEIVDKVSNDTLGIGIVSAAFVDIKKVDIIAVNFGKHNRIAIFPNSNNNGTPGIYPIKCNWPFQRKLYAYYTRKKASEAVVSLSFINHKKSFTSGPIYKASYWPIL